MDSWNTSLSRDAYLSGGGDRITAVHIAVIFNGDLQMTAVGNSSAAVRAGAGPKVRAVWTLATPLRPSPPPPDSSSCSSFLGTES